MFPVDTNIFLELLLDQEKADEAEHFILTVTADHLHVTDFSLHSIGAILFSRRMHEAFAQFVEDVFVNGRMRLVSLAPSDTSDIADAARRFGLDFDDAYQYAAAKKLGLAVVSFDADFDKTNLGRRTPALALEQTR